MAVNSSTRCTPQLHRLLPSRLPLASFNWTSSRPGFSMEAPSPRLVSVRSRKPGAEGFGTKRSTTKRKGWINQGIKGPESIADHMYRMALMALIAGDLPGVNRERCIKIAIVHDIAEAIVGDITPSDGVPKEEKSRREQAALNEICRVLGGGMRAEEIKELWREYEDNSSLEANLVKDFDKVHVSYGQVEMILQALEYETEHGKVLDEFFLSTAGKFQTEIGKSWAAEINSRRNSGLANGHN
ncbi:HD domain-containing protein 2 [Morella rubra]|uniref:5'-deoxynucleotidase n=1 Tax=Morella rubra TaxID=262757 RepID=A0A6A1V1E1_9ROSI|nr:HD domain-containing protein 2 [Morella rubra]